MELISRTEAGDTQAHIKAKRSRYIRFFNWVYNSDPRDTCMLFWGTILLPFLLLFMLVVFPLGWMAEQIARGLGRSFNRLFPPAPVVTASEERRLEEEQMERITEKRGRRAKRLERFSNIMGKGWFKVEPIVIFALPIAGVLAVLAIVAFAIYAIIVWTSSVLVFLAYVAVTIGIVALAMGLIIGLEALAKRMRSKPRKAKDRNPGLLRRAFRSVHDHTCAKIDVVD